MIARYISGAVHWSACPAPVLPEYAFTGRSNVGKSSLINAITGMNKLAKISATPGKTQIINHFLIDESWYLADLPGYGYARVSKSTREKWEPMMKDYLNCRENLLTTFVLIDSRLEPQKADLSFINWLGASQIPLALVFTKADKCTKNELQKSVSAMKRALSATWDEFPELVITSAVSRTGLDELHMLIQKLNQHWKKK